MSVESLYLSLLRTKKAFNVSFCVQCYTIFFFFFFFFFLNQLEKEEEGVLQNLNSRGYPKGGGSLHYNHHRKKKPPARLGY